MFSSGHQGLLKQRRCFWDRMNILIAFSSKRQLLVCTHYARRCVGVYLEVSFVEVSTFVKVDYYICIRDLKAHFL